MEDTKDSNKRAVKILTGVLCFIFGVACIVLALPDPKAPFTSGTGIYTGVGAIFGGVFDLLLAKAGLNSSHAKLKCLLHTVRVFIGLCFHTGVVHFAHGVWGVVVCTQEGGEGTTCGGVHWSANIVVAAANLTTGFMVIVVVILTIRQYAKVSKELWRRTKVQDDIV